MSKGSLKVLTCLIVAFGFISFSLAQYSPFVSEKLHRDLNNELSGDRGFEYIRWMSHYHRPTGSKGYMAVAKLLADWAHEFGLENVQTVKQKYESARWDAISGELWVIEPEEIKLGSYAEIALSIPNNCPSAHELVEIVDIGAGLTPKHFEGKDVAGKAVLTSSSPSMVMNTAVWKRGATGIVSYYSSRTNPKYDYPDQVAYGRLRGESNDGEPSKWAFMVSPRKGLMLKKMIESSNMRKKPVKIKVDIETEFNEPGEQAYVWAEIRGSEIHDQDIVLTAHIQEEKSSANDDASGCASILEVGRTLNRLIQEDRIPRPKRDIVCWWVDEISSERQYFRDHPEERQNMLISINQDMVGAKQSMDSRMQFVSRTPNSLPSYLSDIVENITEYVMSSNTAFLAVRGDQDFTKPILSNLGTRERFAAMIVPHYNNSDQMVFCEGMIGVPAVGLINWPDPYIHSTADDLDNVDQTQLKRNAFIVAAAVLFVANAGDAEVPLIASEVFSRGLERIGRDLNTGLHHMRENKSGDLDDSFQEARNLVLQAVIRESKALRSVLVFADPGGKNEKHVLRQVEKLSDLENDFTKELDEFYVLLSGKNKAPRMELTVKGKELASKIPVNIESVDEYYQKRGWGRDLSGLHSIMAWECYNFVDGKNSYLDIYQAVHAEAMSAGEFYYGKVTLKAVEALLDAAVKKGFIILKAK